MKGQTSEYLSMGWLSSFGCDGRLLIFVHSSPDEPDQEEGSCVCGHNTIPLSECCICIEIFLESCVVCKLGFVYMSACHCVKMLDSQ